MDLILQNLATLDEAIHDCLRKQQVLPALILIYSGIDIVASLESKQGDAVKASFTRWVDSYMLPSHQLECTALELYAARCGMVHTLTAVSDLSRQGKARTINYAWGSASENDLRKSAKRLGRTMFAVVHVDNLHEAFRLGVLKWADEVKGDAKRQKRVEANRPGWFMNLPSQQIKDFLAVTS